jgi:early secretory antigenic target protein ESAT-6
MANDGMLLVNFGSLQQASADIARALGTLQTQLDQLESDGARLYQTWDGAAQQAYTERQKKWRAAAADLTSILQNIMGAVDRSAEDYISTERQATQRFQ